MLELSKKHSTLTKTILRKFHGGVFRFPQKKNLMLKAIYLNNLSFILTK